MDKIIQVAKEQGFAILCAVGVVTYISPTTSGGVLLLALVTVAFVNLLMQLFKYLSS